MEPMFVRSVGLSMRHRFYGMTYRCYHAKHLKVSKMYPGIIGAAEGKGKLTKGHNEDSVCNSQKLMLQNHLIYGGASGTYTTLPPLTRSLEKLQKIIDQEMQNIGAQKVIMPCLALGTIWKKSDRWSLIGPELIKLKDRHEKDLCLSPTHEEAITSMIAADISLTPARLPLKLYQIGKKFRDEMRPKHGLLRGREFEMKDLYTFDLGPEEAMETYKEVCEAYQTIFERLELDAIKVEADTGAMGGNYSHEFHLAAPVGEDTLLQCPECGKCQNEELGSTVEDSKSRCTNNGCPSVLNKISGIEIAHAFILGTKYSDIFNARIKNIGKDTFLRHYMGCYGIGITRLLAAAVEVLSSETDIRWPAVLAPHQICIISQQTGYYFEESLAIATSVQEDLLSQPNLKDEVILDDRFKLSIGKRIKQSYQAGFPHVIVVGKKVQQDPPMLEYHDVGTGEIHVWSIEQVIDRLSQINTVIV